MHEEEDYPGEVRRGNTVPLTKATLDALMTEDGGYTRATIEALGVDWPLEPGWKSLVFGWSVPSEVYEKALEGKTVFKPWNPKKASRVPKENTDDVFLVVVRRKDKTEGYVTKNFAKLSDDREDAAQFRTEKDAQDVGLLWRRKGFWSRWEKDSRYVPKPKKKRDRRKP